MLSKYEIAVILAMFSIRKIAELLDAAIVHIVDRHKVKLRTRAERRGASDAK